MTHNDNNYLNKLKNKIISNVKLKGINYINCYDNYYIVLDDEYLYLYDKEYHEILKEDIILMHENTNNYDIIYKDGTFMYLGSTKKDNKLLYQYYSIYNYELLDEVLVGGYDD